MRKSHKLFSVLAGSLMASTVGVPALAQDDGGLSIEEIIITAEKREASLQDTAISISAFDADMMDKIGIAGAADIANYTPGMTYTGSPNRISIRGVGRLTNELGSEPGVAIYRDGIYTNEAASVSDNTFMIDRIEVLRGPQGTLYGRNAVGGAASVYSKRPTEEFEGEARLQIQSFNSYMVGLAMSGPLFGSEKFRVRLAATRQDGDGFLKNVAGTGDQNGFGADRYDAQFEWDINDRLQWWVRFEHNDWNSGGGGTLALDPYNKTSPIDPSPFTADFNVDFQQLVTNPTFGIAAENPSLTDFYTVDYDHGGSIVLLGNRWTSHLTYDWDNWQLKYIYGFNGYDWVYSADYDRTSRTDIQYLELIEQNEDISQHELQLISDLGGDVEFIFGAFYFKDENEQPYTLVEPTSTVLATPVFMDFTGAFCGGPPGCTFDAPPNPTNIFYHQRGVLDSDSYAAYSQVDFYVNEQVHLTGGLRYSRDEKTGYEEQRIIYDDRGAYSFIANVFIPGWAWFNAATPVPGSQTRVAWDFFGGMITATHQDTWEALTWSLGGDYKPNDDHMYYAKVSTGYKAGGFKLGSLSAFPKVDEETMVAYEIGYKGQFSDTFQLNAAAYWYVYDDMQTPVATIINGVNHSLLLSAEEAKQFGIELDAQWLVNEHWTIFSTYTYMDTELTKMGGAGARDTGDICSLDPLNAADAITLADPTLEALYGIAARRLACTPDQWMGQQLAGNELVKSPKNKFTLNTIHNWGAGDDGEMTLAVSYVYMDDQHSSIFNIPMTKIPSFNRVDARLSYNRPDDGVSISAYVRNATDEEIIDRIGRSGWLFNHTRTASVQAPRTYGLQVDIDF